MSSAAVKERQNHGGIVTGVDLIIWDSIMIQRIRTKRAEVAIEGTVLLQQHDDVLDALQTTIGYNVHRGCSRGCVALRVRGRDGVSGILRR